MQQSKLTNACTAVSSTHIVFHIWNHVFGFYHRKASGSFFNSQEISCCYFNSNRHECGFYVMLYPETFNGKVVGNFSKVMHFSLVSIWLFKPFCLIV